VPVLALMMISDSAPPDFSNVAVQTIVPSCVRSI
jgi:hypothetical protein